MTEFKFFSTEFGFWSMFIKFLMIIWEDIIPNLTTVAPSKRRLELPKSLHSIAQDYASLQIGCSFIQSFVQKFSFQISKSIRKIYRARKRSELFLTRKFQIMK